MTWISFDLDQMIPPSRMGMGAGPGNKGLDLDLHQRFIQGRCLFASIVKSPAVPAAQKWAPPAKLNPDSDDENAFRCEGALIGESFSRFQEMRRMRLREAVICFAEFKTGLMRRMAWEEETLFPLFEKKLGTLAASISTELRSEHDQIRTLLGAIEENLARGDIETERDEAALEAVLSAHNHREHEVVYPLLD